MIEKLKHSKMTRKSKEEQISSTKKNISSSLFSFQYFSLIKQKTESETLKKFKERITKNRVSVVCENKFVCADAFYLSLAKRIHRCIPNQSCFFAFSSFFIFYQLFFACLFYCPFGNQALP